MIIAQDHDFITTMVGPEVFKKGYPEDFLKEYETRARMLARCGMVGGLGIYGVMQILRDFRIEPPPAPKQIEVADWRQIEEDTVVIADGQRGSLKGVLDGGSLLVKIDSRRSPSEFPAALVKILAPKIEGVSDEAFESEDELTDKMRALQDEEEASHQASKEDQLFAEWGNLDANTKVIAEIDGQDVEAAFIDIQGEEIVVEHNEESISLPAEKVRLPVEA